MKQIINFNGGWQFFKGCGFEELTQHLKEQNISVTLPHTWNAQDGQDGGNDYFRGTCCYVKHFQKPQENPGGRVLLKFEGVNSQAAIWLNGRLIKRHEGGYSAFYAELTGTLSDENTLVVEVDNSPNDRVYPQRADFTFYGGIYRDVWLILTENAGFAVNEDGGTGIWLTPSVGGDLPDYPLASLDIQAEIFGAADEIRIKISQAHHIPVSFDEKTEVCVPVEGSAARLKLPVKDCHLWNGVNDPYLYTVQLELLQNGRVVDAQIQRIGFRSFSFDPEKGFFLNGVSYPLRGVCRHQDREGVGNAITEAMQSQDMELIREMGANTIRLAHYQHSQYFYDLCDQYGMAVWAEIPYITEHMPSASPNTTSQLKELITQNYNHPCIVCWCLANEITVRGTSPDLENNLKTLHALAHKLDPSRPTVLANAFMLETDSPILDIPDLLSYNLYFGWYMGELEDNDQWFDSFHKEHPDKIIGLSEYGADANITFQAENASRGDYTEQYQALYHEHMIRLISKRPYIWATHVWNMFDFGADAREEGGKMGLNQKGLVTFDRKTKKDAFYLYKAWLGHEPFVHLCGKQYVNREGTQTQIKVYSNQDSVTLWCDGEEVETQTGKMIFTFKLPMKAADQDMHITVKSGTLEDHMVIRHVLEADLSYVMAKGMIQNWFDSEGLTCTPGFYSLKDTLGDIRKSSEGHDLIEKLLTFARSKRGDVAQGVHSPVIEKMMNAMTVEQLIRQAGDCITKEMAIELNQALNKIPKVC